LRIIFAAGALVGGSQSLYVSIHALARRTTPKKVSLFVALFEISVEVAEDLPPLYTDGKSG
jgi:hypothetical protein